MVGAGACVVLGAGRVVEVGRGLDVVAVDDRVAGAGEGVATAAGGVGAGAVVGPEIVSGG